MTTVITAIKAVPTAQLRRHPRNIREDLGDVTELADSLRTQGVLQPLLVAPRDHHGEELYVVLDGNRRLAAARQAGLARLPCLITSEGSKEQTLSTMLAAALHERVAPIDQARAFRELLDEGVDLDELVARTGYSARTIRERIALLELPPQAQAMIGKGELTLTAARDLSHQVRAQRHNGRPASVPRGAKQTWLDRDHPLAEQAQQLCIDAHRATRAIVGRVACGQCWQAAIEQHARTSPSAPVRAVS